MTVRVRLLGRPAVEAAGPPPRAAKSWAVLARVALADRPVRRADLAEELFGDADDPLGALRWALADLRRSLDVPGLLRSDPLSLPADLAVDVRELRAGELPDDALGGTLLDGVELRHCADFEVWLATERVRLALVQRDRLRTATLRALAAGDTGTAVRLAERAVALDAWDDDAQELLLRALVAHGDDAAARARLAALAAAADGRPLSPALRNAVCSRADRVRTDVRSGVTARALLAAGRAALDAGAADAGVETLRRALDDAEHGSDTALLAQVLAALGAALVHAVRGADGEGAVVLHRALTAARQVDGTPLTVEILRELAFVDVQAGRHTAALESLDAADAAAGTDAARSGLLALRGMATADLGRHRQAAALLDSSIALATASGSTRQALWSAGVRARSLLLGASVSAAATVASAALDAAREQRWTAFLPWPQALLAECVATEGDWAQAADLAAEAFAIGCELGDPCWEGMAARMLGLVAAADGDDRRAWRWLVDARRRCDRVPDRYVWVSCYIGAAHVELARTARPDLAAALAERLDRDAVRADLPEFRAWAAVHLAELATGGRRAGAVRRARAAADGLESSALQRRTDLLDA
jgi:DNA-binding SARP family transcriptional activator